MADSIDKKEFTEKDFAKLKDLRQIHPSERTELSDLPGWAKVAIMHKALFEISFKDTLKLLGINRAPSTLNNYWKTPAGKMLRESVDKFRDDPVAMAEALLRSSAMHITVDRLIFLEMAKASGNFVEADKIARDLQDRVPELAKKSASKSGAGGMTIHVTLPGGNNEPIMVESDHHQLPDYQDAEYEVEDG